MPIKSYEKGWFLQIRQFFLLQITTKFLQIETGVTNYDKIIKYDSY